MIEVLFTFPSVLRRQLDAPLLLEREQYLTSLLNQGVSTRRVRTVATMLLHVIRLMGFERLRVVELTEIERASQVWNLDTEYHRTQKIGPSTAESFYYAALKWLRFHDMVAVSSRPLGPSEIISDGFVQFMQSRGMSDQTMRVYISRIGLFLRWALRRSQTLSAISVRDVDEFIEMKQHEGCLPRTIASFCTVFRLFFRYAELRGLNEFKISRGIRNPRIVRYDPLPKGPLGNKSEDY